MSVIQCPNKYGGCQGQCWAQGPSLLCAPSGAALGPFWAARLGALPSQVDVTFVGLCVANSHDQEPGFPGHVMIVCSTAVPHYTPPTSTPTHSPPVTPTHPPTPVTTCSHQNPTTHCYPGVADKCIEPKQSPLCGSITCPTSSPKQWYFLPQPSPQ